jgi:hypothetical protein
MGLLPNECTYIKSSRVEPNIIKSMNNGQRRKFGLLSPRLFGPSRCFRKIEPDTLLAMCYLSGHRCDLVINSNFLPTTNHFSHFLKRFYTPISTVIACKRINLSSPHSSRTAQKLEPEQKLIAAVQLDAAFSLLQLSVQKGEREQI